MSKNTVSDPLLLVILDGFGLSDQEEGNAIAQAETPFLDEIFAQYPWSRLKASGGAVGLPDEQIGNSEVGHMNLGAGRVVNQPLRRINRAIENGDFFENKVLTDVVDTVDQKDGTLHLIGLLSDGGVHSHEDHVAALIELAKKRGLNDVAVHGLLDGRDVPPKSARKYLKNARDYFSRIGQGYFASIGGRYYAMDRDERWDRTEKGYKAIVEGNSEVKETDVLEALETAYSDRDESDEFVTPTVLTDDSGDPRATVKPDDGVIFFNFRPDRARQLTEALTDPDFTKFETSFVVENFATLTEYDEEYDIPVAFPPLELNNVLTEYLSGEGLQQFHTAETEKYAHVTFFFNGGEEESFPGEKRHLVPSPKVSTYDEKPEMSAPEVTDRLIERLRGDSDDFIVLNFANPDMVGHTGDLGATIDAIETIDNCLYRLNTVIQEKNGEMVITSDHGNAETMIDPETGDRHTAHTLSDCPLIYVGPRKLSLEAGTLADVAPTLLELLNLPVPEEMTGHSLVEFKTTN